MERNRSQDNNYKKNKKNLFILPQITIIDKKYLNEPNSLLSKFIHERKNNFIKLINEDMKRPIKLNYNKRYEKKNKNILNKDENNIFLTDNLNSKNNIKENENNSYNNGDNYSQFQNKFNEFKQNRIPKYARIKSYQPIISENWKNKNGLSISKEKINKSSIQNDIEYQYKLISDEYKLLEDNFVYYKTKVIHKINYFESFCSMSLISKINYNKALEETIGILYILPQILLAEFYKLIKNYSGVKIPNKNLLKEKTISDEDKNLNYNNILLISIYEFFKSCYEVYCTLIKEVNDMSLKPLAFNNVINCFQKARFNLNYLASSTENALKNYNFDLNCIRKLKKDRMNTLSVDLTEKMRRQFDFKKNEEKQRKIRIETALENKYDFDLDDNSKKRNNNKKKEFVSFVENKLISNLMKHFTLKVRNEISTQRINKEIEGNYDDDDISVKQKHKVVKIDI